MLPAYKNLLKILDLEKEQQYLDKAVIGGLVKFLQVWHRNAVNETSSAQEKDRMLQIYNLLLNYSVLSSGERQQAAEAVIELVNMDVADLPPIPDEPLLEQLKPTIAPVETKAPEPTESSAPPVKATPAPPASDMAASPVVPAEPSVLDQSVTAVRGISTTYAERLARLNVETVADLIYHFPHRYEDYSSLKRINQLQYGEDVTIIATIWETNSHRTRGGKLLVQSVLSDGTGMIECTWFNQSYLEKQLRPGREIVLSGTVSEYLGRLTFNSPQWEPITKAQLNTGRLVPIYPATKGIKQRWMRRTIKGALDQWGLALQDALPSAIRLAENLLDVKTSINNIHFPENQDLLERARYRLCFEEFLLVQLGVLKQRQLWQQQPGQPLHIDVEMVRAIVDALPFSLTEAQQRVLTHILDDMQLDHPMSRLLQGDVGSGKTVVVFVAMLMAAANGKQTALMVPTEILAEQHARSMRKLLTDLSKAATGNETLTKLLDSTQVRLLTGSVSDGDKEQIYQEIASGQANVIIGTHALIQEGVAFNDLALAVIDEQHRFGVNQRGALRQKSHNPHMLVMSATPIPRTLSLTIYGDLDVSIIDEMPPNRQEIVTRWLYPRERERAYSFLKSQLDQGRQAFIICPLVDESENTEAKAATTEYERLKKDIFPKAKLGLLHGRLPGAEKEAVMAAFGRGELDILVSTSVVEVGIDVPNATVMMVEGADRFGLAQLHQFRGRVGRGEHKSYCILLADSPTAQGEQRLKIIEQTSDGFVLAEEDLKMRGPGEFFGTRQSGLPDLRVAKLSDVKVLEDARRVAMQIFKEDPDLQKPEHGQLAANVAHFWQAAGDPN